LVEVNPKIIKQTLYSYVIYVYKLNLYVVGLGASYWKQVISTLRDIIPVYDKVNRVISLGKDELYRYEGINGNIKSGDLVLDAGSGFGNMSLTTFKVTTAAEVRIVIYDPIFEMLQSSRQRLVVELISSGIFEHMPFKDNTFDVVMCGYSLRDAINLEIAVSEIHRILKKNGRFLIVDLGKPDNKLIRLGVSIYLKYIIKIFAYVIARQTGLKFQTLYGTFLKWPQNNTLNLLLKKQFSQVDFRTKLMGGSIIVSSTK
jgi:demethylmenaquinone methyltransferase / 2-methoxy-6-polyprenyl-1,4-benzoquinol methylase